MEVIGSLKTAWKQDRRYLTIRVLRLCVTLLNFQSLRGETDWLGLGHRYTS